MTGRDWRLPVLLALLVIATGLAGLPGAFVFDDHAIILGDPRVQSLQAWWDAMPGMRPLTKLSYALDYEAWTGPAGFRLTSLTLHALNVMLAFELLATLARRMRVADAAGAQWLAAVGALVFALHPAQTESVSYLAARSQLWMALFSLLALRLALPLNAGTALPRRQSILSLACMALAAAGKETALILPLALVLCWGAIGLSWREAWRRSLPWWGVAALLGLVGLLFLPYGELLDFSLQWRSPAENLLAQGEAWVWLSTQLWRWDLLNADPALPVAPLWTAPALALWTLVVGLLAWTLRRFRRHPGPAFGLLWMVIWLLPTNSLIARLDLANLRQLYLPLLGAGWWLGLGILQWREHAPALAQRLAAPAVLALAVLLCVGTGWRNRVYTDERVFWQDVTRKAPHNDRAWNNLGVAHAAACEPLAAAAAFDEAAARAGPEAYLPRLNRLALARGELPGQPAAARCRLSP